MITNPGQLSHGLPPGEPLAEHARLIKDLQRQVDELRSASMQQIQMVANSTGGQTFPVGSTYITCATSQTVTVPVGFDRLTVIGWGSTTATFTASGSLGCQTGLQPLSGPLPSMPAASSSVSQTVQAGAVGVTTTQLFLTYNGFNACAGSTFNVITQEFANAATTAGASTGIVNGLLMWTRS